MDRKGLPPYNNIAVDSTVDIEIPAFKDLKPIHLEGTLKWSKKEISRFFGGMELNDVLYEHEWIKPRDHFNLAPLQRGKPVHRCLVITLLPDIANYKVYSIQAPSGLTTEP